MLPSGSCVSDPLEDPGRTPDHPGVRARRADPVSSSEPTPRITQVFAEFLAEEKARLSHKTYLKYASVIDLFRLYLENYWPGHDQAEYARITAAGGNYCGTFGPEEIPGGFAEFLGYFMPRKVMAGNETMRAAGTVTKKLAKWLASKGYAAVTEDAWELVRGSARDLPGCQKLLRALDKYLDEHPVGSYLDVLEGHFWIQRVEAGKLWLRHLLSDDPDIGPFPVPATASRLAKPGWDLGGKVARTAQGWRLVEVWNLSP
jgi:hypothetical protein